MTTTFLAIHFHIVITAIINLGRIAAVLGYCYRLCKTYIQQHLNSADLVAFLGVIAGFLVRFLFEAKFYEWLSRQGGWVSEERDS